MPSCFQLTRKSTGKVEKLSQIDKELCELLGEECHPRFYIRGWYDAVGFMFSQGINTKEDQEKWWTQHTKPEHLEEELRLFREHYGQIQDYIFENFTSNSWYEHK